MYVYLATYVKYFIALRAGENQHVKETAAIKKNGETARFFLNIYLEICFLAVIGNETDLKTQISNGFYAETAEPCMVTAGLSYPVSYS